MSTYRAIEVTRVREFRPVERETVAPGPGHVRIKVEACGVCRTDALAVEGMREDPSVPVVPGHEIAGVIDAVGEGVSAWRVGERVGVGFLGGQCGECDLCRRGDFVYCQNQARVGVDIDGGFAEIVYARTSGLVRIPDTLSSIDAAPLLCAGLTTFNALREAGARPGDLVAIQGIGGLGHIGLQYAAKLGYRVAAIARGSDKEKLAKQLGADYSTDSTSTDPGEALQKLGGAGAIIATAANGASMSPLVPGLAPRGRMVIVGATPDPINVATPDLIFSARTVTGSLTGSAIDNEDQLAFSARSGVRPMTELMPLSEAAQAYGQMISGAARFRVVLDTTV